MVKLYVSLIKRGLWTIDKVPAKWVDAVKAILENETA